MSLQNVEKKMHKETLVRGSLARWYHDFSLAGANYRIFASLKKEPQSNRATYRLQIYKGKILPIAGVDIPAQVREQFLEQERLLYTSPKSFAGACLQLLQLLLTFFQPRISPNRFVFQLSSQFARQEGRNLNPETVAVVRAMAFGIFTENKNQSRLPRFFNFEDTPMATGN